MMKKISHNDLFKGGFGEILDKGVNMLQYADDTIFLIQDDESDVRNLKFIFFWANVKADY